MSQGAISTVCIDTQSENIPRLNRRDWTWALGLYGTAIGAGTLFLPINAGLGGLFPLLIMALLAFPMTFFSHLGLTRFVLSGSARENNITEVVEEHFGTTIGHWITLLYFFSIYPILLVYGVAITNTVSSFMEHQLHMVAPSRPLLAGILVFGLMMIVHFGRDTVVKIMSVLVFPFIVSLVGLAFYLIPHWTGAIFEHSYVIQPQSFIKTLWLAVPVMVFSFNHSPIISSFAVAQKSNYGKDAEQKSFRILQASHIMMVLTVLFFLFSCVLSLTSADLIEAKKQNISILSYLANHFNHPIFEYIAPCIAFVAVSKSFLGHYLGASEGFNGLIIKSLRRYNINLRMNWLNWMTAFFIGITTWLVATMNPSILGMIETLGGPIIAMLLFLMPMYAIYKVPALRHYANKKSNIFIIFMGCVSISAILYLCVISVH